MYFTLIKWWSSKFFLLAFVFIVPAGLSSLSAQILQPARFEIPVVLETDQYNIISANESGLFLYRQLQIDDTEQLHLIALDTALQEKLNGFMPLETNYLLMGKKYFNGSLYLLFRYYNYSRNDLLLYIINNEGEFKRFVIRGYIPFVPGEFQITEKAVLIGGYFNKVPLVLHYSLEKHNSKVLPGIFNESGELTQVQTNEDGSFVVLISAFNHLKQRTVWIKSYDPDGNLISNFPLDTDNNKHLIFGRSLKNADNMQIIAGVYGNRSAQFSHGVFVASIDPSGIQKIKYYQFADLENFFKYMKAKKEKRVKNRIERRKIKGKKVRMHYRFLVHELVPYKDQFILLGEAFYPKYRSMDNTGYSTFFTPSYSGGIIQNGRIFEGYYYTHAIVMGFNANGTLLWDNSFEINDVRTFTLEQFVKLEVQDDRIALLYLFDNAIRSKIIQNNEVLEGKSFDQISTGSANEAVVRNYFDKSRLEYWYDNYLFAYGMQEIEMQETRRNRVTRRVFYINKIKRVDK